VSIRFDRRVAIVTGAGGGLGRCYALELARRGAKVVVNDLGGALDGTSGSPTMAQAVVEEITAAGGEAMANHDSVTDRAAARRMVDEAVSRFGSVDILVNNAGIVRDKTFAKMEPDDFEVVVDVHLMGAVNVTRAAFPLMKERGYGRVVFTTSSSGLFGNFGQTNYGAAKLGLVGFMNTLKLEGAKYDIKVNSVAPTAATRMTDGLWPAEVGDAMAPEHVVPAVIYLCSEDAPTGHIIEAGGSYFARVAIVEARGAVLGPHATAEDVAARYDEIADLSGARTFTAGSDVATNILKAISDTSDIGPQT
jgi:NAD(P)-dependent dehydrogenase (short-subunit alcohol dehydrogenase family)